MNALTEYGHTSQGHQCMPQIVNVVETGRRGGARSPAVALVPGSFEASGVALDGVFSARNFAEGRGIRTSDTEALIEEGDSRE